MALLSRLHPSWFPADQAAAGLPEVKARLNYPLNYWNGLAALIAMGVPLVLVAAHQARSLLLQALAIAALPAMALAGFYTLSRGGAIELGFALAFLFALYPRRLALLPPLLIAGLGSVILIARRRPARSAPGRARQRRRRTARAARCSRSRSWCARASASCRPPSGSPRATVSAPGPRSRPGGPRSGRSWRCSRSSSSPWPPARPANCPTAGRSSSSRSTRAAARRRFESAAGTGRYQALAVRPRRQRDRPARRDRARDLPVLVGPRGHRRDLHP